MEARVGFSFKKKTKEQYFIARLCLSNTFAVIKDGMIKVAVVGATGLVGRTMMKVLEERNFHIDEFIPVASDRSKGMEVKFKGHSYKVRTLAEAVAEKPQIALFSAGSGASLEWAPKFAEVGTTVIDNSSAWRMDKAKKLVVPEVNAHVLTIDDKQRYFIAKTTRYMENKAQTGEVNDEASLSTEDSRKIYLAALHALTPSYRILYNLTYVDEVTPDTIIQNLEIARETYKAELEQARFQFKQYLNTYLHENGLRKQ